MKLNGGATNCGIYYAFEGRYAWVGLLRNEAKNLKRYYRLTYHSDRGAHIMDGLIILIRIHYFGLVLVLMLLVLYTRNSK